VAISHSFRSAGASPVSSGAWSREPRNRVSQPKATGDDPASANAATVTSTGFCRVTSWSWIACVQIGELEPQRARSLLPGKASAK
jgi:hypothetical protein